MQKSSKPIKDKPNSKRVAKNKVKRGSFGRDRKHTSGLFTLSALSSFRLKVLIRATLVFGLLAIVATMQLPDSLQYLGDALLLGYNGLILALIFMTNLSFIKRLSVSSFRDAKYYSSIEFWSAFEALFWGTGVILLSRLLSAQVPMGSESQKLYYVVLLVAGLLFFSSVFQQKLWEAELRIISNELEVLARKRGASRQVLGLLERFYGFRITKGDVEFVSPPPRELIGAVTMHRIYYIIGALVFSLVVSGANL